MAAEDRRTVLLTGATGFLGPYVAAALARTGWRVRAALRQDTPFIAGDKVVVGPIGASTNWTTALAGVDAVVHLAALAHRPISAQLKQRDAYFEINTTGTIHLAQQAANAGVRHFVFLSSISVNGSTTEGRAPFRESDMAAPRTVYGETKFAAEQGLSALAARHDMAVTVIRPPMIYGRSAKGSFHTLVRAVSAGFPLPFATLRNRRAFVAAENVAGFVACRMSQRPSGLDTYIIADDEQVSTADFARQIGRTLDRDTRMFPMPAALLKFALRRAGKEELIHSALDSLELDTSKARAAGWRPDVTMAEGLARAIGHAGARRSEG